MRAVRRTPRTKTKKGDKEKEKEKKSKRGKHDTTPSHQPSEKIKDRTPTPRNTRDGHHTTKQHHIKGRDRFPLQKTGFRHGFRARTPGFPLHAGRIPDPQGTMEGEGV
jgi:hypothetical protein